MIKRIIYPKDGTARVGFFSKDGEVYGHVLFNEIIKNGKVVSYKLANNISLLKAAQKMDKTPEEVYSMAFEELTKNNLKIGDDIEFSYLDAVRVGKIVDIVKHFSTKENEVIETFIFLKDNDGNITPYELREMEDIDVLKDERDWAGRIISAGDFVQFKPKDREQPVWGVIDFGTDGRYCVDVHYPLSMQDKSYSLDDGKVYILSKYDD